MRVNKNLAVFKIHDIRGVLIDKDGTLLDFHKTWRPLYDKITHELKVKLNLDQEDVCEINRVLGVTPEGFTADSIFVKDDYTTIQEAVIMKSHLSDENKEHIMKEAISMVREYADSYSQAHAIEGIHDTLAALKEQGLILGLVTSDLKEIAYKHLKEAQLDKTFDFIACDDGMTKVKPHGETLYKFCDQYDLDPHEVAMIGDSIVDMEYAKQNNMGCAVYVRSGYPDVKAERKADMILNNINQLLYSQ